MKHVSASAVIALLLLLFIPPALADNATLPYVELADASTITVDWSKGSTQAVTLHGNRTFAFLNGQKGGKYLLVIKQDETGSRTIKWPQSVHWPGVYAPTFTTTANKKDYITFFYDGLSYDALGFTQNL